MSPAELHHFKYQLHNVVEPDQLDDDDMRVMLDLMQRRYNSLAVRQAAS